MVLAFAAGDLPYIRHVNLSHNRSGDKGASAVARMIKSSKIHLRDVDLSETGITATGARTLLDSISAKGLLQCAQIADMCNEILKQ